MWSSWRMRWWSWMWLKQGQIEVDGGDGCDCGSGGCGIECGDGHAEETSPAAIPLPPLHPPLNPIPNQSKPIVQLILLSHSPISL